MLEKFEPYRELPRSDDSPFANWSDETPPVGMEIEFYCQAEDGSRTEITRAMLRNIAERKAGSVIRTSDPMIVSESGELIGWAFKDPRQVFWRPVSIICHD